METLLSDLLNGIVCFIETAVITVLNLAIVALGALWEVLIGLLPNMPDHPTLPSFVVQGVRWANYVVDLPWIIGYMASFFALMAGLWAIMIPLRWLKAAD
jgi:isoprenylcysteine carboxyl methyltransferase (ICMT) family protein YpbQ